MFSWKVLECAGLKRIVITLGIKYDDVAKLVSDRRIVALNNQERSARLTSGIGAEHSDDLHDAVQNTIESFGNVVTSEQDSNKRSRSISSEMT
jgi:hypothetical protein